MLPPTAADTLSLHTGWSLPPATGFQCSPRKRVGARLTRGFGGFQVHARQRSKWLALRHLGVPRSCLIQLHFERLYACTVSQQNLEDRRYQQMPFFAPLLIRSKLLRSPQYEPHISMPRHLSVRGLTRAVRGEVSLPAAPCFQVADRLAAGMRRLRWLSPTHCHCFRACLPACPPAPYAGLCTVNSARTDKGCCNPTCI